jgi:polyribonucleotide nucleotidyltransferase
LLPKPEKLEDGENGGEHRHRRRSHHKPRHHNESGEAPKNPDKSETKEQAEE